MGSAKQKDFFLKIYILQDWVQITLLHNFGEMYIFLY